MNQPQDNLVLELLRAIRSDVSDIKEDVRVIKMRQGSAEMLASLQQMEIARHSSRFDEIDARIERIEHRLQLRDEH